MPKTLTAERARELVSYDEKTGVFTYRCSRYGDSTGARAGWDSGKYRRIVVDGCSTYEHRLAWLIVHGVWPPHEIDHINGNRLDNRIANLREATRAENSANTGRRRSNTTGFKGVTYDRKNNRYRAKIEKDRRHIHIGRFDTAEEAYAAYCAAAERLVGEYAHHLNEG